MSQDCSDINAAIRALADKHGVSVLAVDAARTFFVTPAIKPDEMVIHAVMLQVAVSDIGVSLDVKYAKEPGLVVRAIAQRVKHLDETAEVENIDTTFFEEGGS